MLITGGAGFIGSHLVNRFAHRYPAYRLVVLDALTYAADPAYIAPAMALGNTTLVQGDIADADAVAALFAQHPFDGVIHLAAESHVDRSIADPLAFVHTNITGTAVLLNAARLAWHGRTDVRFHHVSTDEVYGSLGPTGAFTETTPYDPRSPYSASKAAADHLVRAYGHTYHMPVLVTNCSNNYGPHQYPEKLIPLVLHRIFHREPIPVYGTGMNVRDWLFVDDHAEALDVVFHKGVPGETYNIGTENEWTNIDLVHALCRLADDALGRPPGTSATLITFVADRAGHDMRYAIDPAKMRNALGWTPQTDFETGLAKTIQWYLARATAAQPMPHSA